MNRSIIFDGDRVICFVLIVILMGYGWRAAASIPPTSRRQSNPDAWLTVQDKTGACRMSVPPDWKQQAKWPGHVIAPEQTETTLIAGAKRTRAPMSEADQKALDADKVFENSPGLWFYASKPISGAGGKPNLIVYHVNAIRDDGTCLAQILVNETHSEDEIRRIAVSVKPTHSTPQLRLDEKDPVD
jgi:hypothetical protein